jgi:EmrB/QacA subfamily drug resistance transporter
MMSQTHTPHAEAPPQATDRRSTWALFLLALVQAMLVIDVTVVNVALPVLGRELGIDGSLTAWAIAAYAVPFGGMLMLGGRLSDLFGARRMLLVGLMLFGVASLAAGIATDATLFLVARATQGVGAAVLSPAALSTLVTRFHGPARHRALAVWGAIGGAGAAVGVLLGGLLTAGPGWRWIFFVNVPVAILVAVALPLVVDAMRRDPDKRLDVAGALLATTGFGSVVAAITLSPVYGSGAGLLAGAGVLLLIGFVLVERRVTQPMVRLGILRSRAVASGTLLMFAAPGFLVGALFLLTFLLQDGQGWSPLETGFAFLPIALGVTVGAHLAGRLVGRIGPRRVAGSALTIAVTGLIAAAVATGVPELGTAAPLGAIAGVAFAGLGLGASFVCATTSALSNVAHEESGSASGLLNSFHELGAGVGVAVLAAVVVEGFGFAFLVLAALALVIGPIAGLLLPKGVPASGGATFVH